MLVGVTGATGFIGQALVPALLHAGHGVKVLTRSSAKLQGHSWANEVTVCEGTLNDEAALASFCTGCEIIIHLAALAHTGDARDAEHEVSSVAGTRHLLQAMTTIGVGSLVYISSIKASSRPDAGGYALSKHRAEGMVIAAGARGLKAVILRPAIVYGPGMKGNLPTWLRRLDKGWMPRLPASAARLRMIGRPDLCRAILDSFRELSGEVAVFAVDDGNHYPLAELDTSFRVSLGRAVPVVVLPKALWWLGIQLAGGLGYLTGRSRGFARRTWQTLFVEDSDRAPSLPGFQAEQDLYISLGAIIDSL